MKECQLSFIHHLICVHVCTHILCSLQCPLIPHTHIHMRKWIPNVTCFLFLTYFMCILILLCQSHLSVGKWFLASLGNRDWTSLFIRKKGRGWYIYCILLSPGYFLSLCRKALMTQLPKFNKFWRKLLLKKKNLFFLNLFFNLLFFKYIYLYKRK